MGIPHSSPFFLKGQFLSFVYNGGKVKYVRFETAQTELQIKISKTFRHSIDLTLKPSDRIQIYGIQKTDHTTGCIKLKADRILRITSETQSETQAIEPQVLLSQAELSLETSDSKPLKLHVCQKSGCQKKGSKKQAQSLNAVLRDRNLHHQIVLQETGCLGKCSMAPNIVLMPGKKRLSGMTPEAIVDLLEGLV